MVFSPNSALNYRDNHNTSDQRDELGAVYNVGDRSWMYVKAAAAISAGEAVIFKISEATITNIESNDNTGDRATGKFPSLTDSGAGLTANAHVGSLLYINSGTGAGQMKRIRKNTSTQIWYEALYPETGEGDPFTTDLSTDSDVVIISPFHVVKAAVTSLIQPGIGVAVDALSSGYYGYILCAGPVLAKSGTGNNALVANKPVLAGGDDTAGQVTGVANGNDLFDATPFGFALHAGADDQKAPIWVTPLR